MPSPAPPRELPMFPLGTVLLPGMVLPLHIFEPRYREMVRVVLEGGREFGVVLIERGHEVGGGERRTDVGTVARVLEAEELEDGRWLVIAVGRERVAVDRWLEDDPYPRALVRRLPDRAIDPEEVAALHDEIGGTVRRLLALRSELGEDVPSSFTALHDDPSVASFQASILSGANPHDAQRLLTAPDAGTRFHLLREVLEDTEAVLRFQLSGDAGSERDG